MEMRFYTKCVALLMALCMFAPLALEAPDAGHVHDFGVWETVTAPTCTAAGEEVHACVSCGATESRKAVALGHVWADGDVVTAPAVEMDGEKAYTCMHCGVVRTEKLPATACGGNAACPSAALTDVPAPDDWAHSGIDYCVVRGLMCGVSKTAFDPNAPTSRAMVVTILWRQAGSPAPEHASSFVDLQQDWYVDAVAWAAENGVVFGKDTATFDPDAAISRQDMAVIFYRYARNVLKLDVSKNAVLTTFPDYGRVSDYARDAMAWANAEGLISGTAVGGTVYLDPLGSAVRAQAARVLANFCKHLEQLENTVDVPVLLYHHLDPDADGSNSMVVTPATFEWQIRALYDAGYTGVSVEELQNYINYGTALPERPIVITFDDGYLSNYEYAFPILQKYNMKATIFVIGSSVGHTEFYKDTSYPLTPHFGTAEIEEMIASGLIDIQSHTYDMHQTPAYETGVARPTIQQLPNETDAAYMQALTEDSCLQKDLLEPVTGQKIVAVAYPKGVYSPLTCTVLAQCGIEATFTTISGSNTIEKGVPQSLMNLNRYGVYESTTPEQILAMVSSARG